MWFCLALPVYVLPLNLFSLQNSFIRVPYPEGGEDDPGDLLLDRLLQDVGQGWHHVVAPELLTELGAEGQ